MLSARESDGSRLQSTSPVTKVFAKIKALRISYSTLLIQFCDIPNLKTREYHRTSPKASAFIFRAFSRAASSESFATLPRYTFRARSPSHQLAYQYL